MDDIVYNHDSNNVKIKILMTVIMIIIAMKIIVR